MLILLLILLLLFVTFFESYNALVSGSKENYTVVKSVCDPNPIKITNCLLNKKITLKDHQKAISRHLACRRGLLCIHSVGSGKTLSAIAAINCLYTANKTLKTIIVTPKSLQDNFIKEINTYDKQLLQKSNIKLYTINEFIRRNVSCKDTLLIIDEAHNLRTKIKKNKNQNAKALVDCAKKAYRVLLLTATPIVNEIYDISNLISMIDGTNNISETAFETAIQDPNYFKCKISFFTPDLDYFKTYYPQLIEKDVFIKMQGQYLKKYNSIENDMLRFDPKKDPTVFYNGVRRASNKIDNNLSSPKIKWIKSFFQSAKGNKKTVVFTHFLENGITLVINILQKMKIPFAHIDGSLSKEKRKKAVNDYNKNITKVLLISKAGSEGLDLKETRYMILMEPSWNPATIKQVIGRGVRYKSHENLAETKRKVTVYKLFLYKASENPKNNYKILLKKAENKLPSIDLYLRARSIKKDIAINSFLESIYALSIENSDCQC